MTSPGVLDAAAAQTGAKESDLEESVTAKLDPGTGVIGVTAEAPTPQRAAQLANATATEFLTQRADGMRQGLESSQASLRDEIARLEAQPDVAAEDITHLRARVADIQVQIALAGKDLRTLRLATPPSSPASPKPLLSAFLALLAGAILASFFFVARDALRKPITSARELERLVGAPVIATMREQRSRRAGRVIPDDTATRLALESWAPPGRKVIVVSAADAPAGATLVVQRLATAFAQAGHDTLVIDADLDQPALHARFGLPLGGGLMRILTRISRGGAVTGTALRRATRQPTESAELAGRLAVLTTGEPVDEPDRLLTVTTLTTLAQVARDTDADYILVRVASITDAPQAALLARSADALVVVTDRKALGTDDAAMLGETTRSLGVAAGLIVLDRPAGAVRREPRPGPSAETAPIPASIPVALPEEAPRITPMNGHARRQAGSRG